MILIFYIYPITTKRVFEFMNNKVEFISSKADHLLDLLKGDNHVGRSNITLYFLLGLYLIVASAHYIKFDFTILLTLSIVALVVLMLIYRLSMQTAIKENSASANYKSYKEVDEVTYLKTKLQYLYSGVMVKYTRTKSIRILYMVMFPFILLLVRDFFQGQGTAGWIGTSIVAILLGSITWWAYFKNDVDDLEISRDDIKSYLGGI